MVVMRTLNENSWVFNIVDTSGEEKKEIAFSKQMAASKEECLQNIKKLYTLMGECIKEKGTMPNIEVYDTTTNENVYVDLSPELERHER